MTTELKTPIERELPRDTDHKNRPLIVRIVPDGVLLKAKGEHWDNAYFVPWQAVYHLGGRLKAADSKVEKKIARAVKRAS